MRRLNNWYTEDKNLQNISSKNRNLIMGRKSILRTSSLDQLKEWASKDVPGAERRKAAK